MSKEIKWTLVEVKASTLKRNPNNPKKRDEKGFNRLKKSLEKYGRVFDGIINTDNSIIDGHSRLETAKPDQILHVFKPSRKLTVKEYKEMNAIYDMAKAGTVDEQILEDQFSDEFFEEWKIGDPMHSKNTSFSLPSGDKTTASTITFTLNAKQTSLLKNAIELSKNDVGFKVFDAEQDNTNKNGNALIYIVSQWERQKI